MGRYATLVLAALCGLSLATALVAAPTVPAEAPQVSTRLERVALFKNGLGYFVRRGELPASPTSVLLGPFAAPMHGTFWVSTPATAGLESVIVRETGVKGEEVDARSIPELLRANVGHAVTVWTDADGKAAITGTLLSYAPDPPLTIPPKPLYLMGPARSSDYAAYSSSRPAYGRADYVLLRTANGVVSISPSAVTRIFFTEDVVTRYQTEVPGSGVDLTVKLRTPHPGDWISLNYLAKGITWAPSYQVDISDPKLARLSASALIINEAEDLTDTRVDFITGYPNLQFQDVQSPIGEKTDLAGFLQQLTGGGYRAPMGATSNVMSQVASYRNAAENAPAPSYGVPQLGQQTEDLFFYPLEHVNLRTGETGYYPLFTISVPYTQLYQWTIPNAIDQYSRYTRPPGGTDEREIVWHSLRLANTSTVPWTTAPAETVKKGQILGQDTLGYTPPSGKETLHITQAVNVRAEQRELEMKRETDVLQRYGSHFDRVTLQGTLQVTNYKAEPITMEIEKTLSGEVIGSDPTPKIDTLGSGITQMNPTQQVTWTITIPPGQKREITYTYQALIGR